MLIRYLAYYISFTSFPKHFNLTRELDIKMKCFDFCDEDNFVDFKVFIGHDWN